MSTTVRRMGEDELRAHVAQHESAFVQQYVEALFEERAEHTAQLHSTARSGYSLDGRTAMRKVQLVLLVVAIVTVMALACAVTRLSG